MIFLFSLLCIICNAQQWSVLHSNYETIALSTSFVSDTNGYVGGGSASLDALVLYTTNGGQNFTNLGIADAPKGALLALDMTDSNVGVGGTLGFFGLPCGTYTNNGMTWNKTHEGIDIVCAAQGVDAVDDNTLVIIGTWVEVTDFDGNGIQISTNGGSTWHSRNWGFTTEARYGSFQSSNMGFVTGGNWPSTNDKSFAGRKFKQFPRELNQHLTYDGAKILFEKHDSSLEANVDLGYVGIIAQATNEGKDWTLMQNFTGNGLYFNEISCTDANNCWACAEGTNKTTAEPAAWIYHTSDGWKSYDVQLSVPGGSLITVDMLSPTFGWAGGALIDGDEDADYYGQFYQTTDGKTWNLVQQLPNFYVFDLSVVDQTHAYAAGTTPLGLSSFAAYSS